MDIQEFIPVFQDSIAPLYIKNQRMYDHHKIHGVLHVSRSLLIANLLSYELSKKEIFVQNDKIFYAVGFHDSGREGSGYDYWENKSRENCYKYLAHSGYSKQYATETADLILKDRPESYNYLCVYDADVLDIMRPCTGIGIGGFDKRFLKLTQIFGERHYDSIIGELIAFILETERMKERLSGIKSLNYLIDYIKENNPIYKMLYESLGNPQ